VSRVVAFGEIMARLAAPGFKRFQQCMPGSLDVTFAGAEASVAASIAYLGGESAFVTALPRHALADACVADLRSLGVDTSRIVRTESGRLGLYFLETGANQRPGNVIYDREGSAASVTPASAYPWGEIFAGAGWFVISGITPAISRNAAEVTRVALRQARERKIPVVLDLNFRSKLWRWESGTSPRELAARTLGELMPYVSVFVGGPEDAVELLGLSGARGTSDWEQAVARQLVRHYPQLNRVALTLREGISSSHQNWAGMLYDAATNQADFAPIKQGKLQPYPITDVVDRLGGGDAFTAALLYALDTPEWAANSRAIAFAVAASCLAHSIEGDYNYCRREEVEALLAGAETGRVNR